MRRIWIAYTLALVAAAAASPATALIWGKLAAARSVQSPAHPPDPHSDRLQTRTARVRKKSTSTHKRKPGKHRKKTKPRPPGTNPGAGMMFGDPHVERALGHAPAGMAEAFPFHDATAGVATSIRIYVDRRSHARNVFAALYSTERGHPKSRITSGSKRRPKLAAWNTIALRPAALRGGRTYWIVLLGKGGAVSFRMRAHGKCRRELSAHRHMSSMPSSWNKDPAGRGVQPRRT